MNLSRKGVLVAEELKKTAASNALSYNELKTIVAIERAVARLSTSNKLASNLIFKGGFVLLKTIATSRFTRDLDVVASEMSQTESTLLIQEALKINLDDGIWFGDSRVEELAHSPYPGSRFIVPFHIGEPPRTKAGLSKLSQIYIDVVVDSYHEKISTSAKMSSLLTTEKPISWMIYPPEYIFSEKLEALIRFGSFSSRAKDIFDLVLLYHGCKNLNLLLKAITTTFRVRQTFLPVSIRRTVAGFDLTALKKAWTGIGKSMSNIPFDEIWHSLLAVLEKIDADRR